MTTKKKLKNIVERRESLLTRALIQQDSLPMFNVVREIYSSLRNKPAENSEFKKAIQVAIRCYQTYIDANLKEDLNEPLNKKKKFRQLGGGRKPIAFQVSMDWSS